MGKKFIAYFDYLGFKDFILNNTIDEQKFIIGNNLREIGNAMSSGKIIENENGFIPDISETEINCLNFSDTIVFWSNDDSLDALENILNISFTFNSRTNLHFFPVRGTLALGEIYSLDESMYNFTVNSVFGQGLIMAHSKAESLNWAGSVIHNSVLSYLEDKGLEKRDYLSEFCKQYNVPYKNNHRRTEYAFRLVSSSLNSDSFKNFKRSIEDNFSNYNKSSEHPSVKSKLQNTIAFLKSFATAI